MDSLWLIRRYYWNGSTTGKRAGWGMQRLVWGRYEIYTGFWLETIGTDHMKTSFQMGGQSKNSFILNWIIRKYGQIDRDKFTLEKAIKTSRYSSTLSLTWAIDGVGGQRHAPAVSPLRKRPSIHCTWGWVGPRAFWTVTENLASTGIRTPDRPDRSELLDRLSYPWVRSFHKGARYTSKIHIRH